MKDYDSNYAERNQVFRLLILNHIDQSFMFKMYDFAGDVTACTVSQGWQLSAHLTYQYQIYYTMG